MKPGPSFDKELPPRKQEAGRFIIEPLFPDPAPPVPLQGATIIKPAVNIDLLTMHRLHSSQLASLSPLLVGADLDLPAEELVIEEEYGRSEEKMAQEDLDILEENMMLVKKN